MFFPVGYAHIGAGVVGSVFIQKRMNKGRKKDKGKLRTEQCRSLEGTEREKGRRMQK